MQPSTTDTPAPPWGAFRRGIAFRALLGMSRATPRVPVVRQLAFLFRRLARAAADGPVDVVHWGHRLRLHTRGNYSEWSFLFMPERWDHRERELLRDELRPGDVFVDVGANAGGYTWWVLHLLGRDSTVLAIEPEPALQERLRFNSETNGFDNVHVLGVAVGTEDGAGWLELDARNRGENALRSNPESSGRAHAVKVPVQRLHRILHDAGVQHVAALKIDVEGLDTAILEDFFTAAPAALYPRLLLAERPGAPLMQRLAGLGYEVVLATPLNVVLRRRP